MAWDARRSEAEYLLQTRLAWLQRAVQESRAVCGRVAQRERAILLGFVATAFLLSLNVRVSRLQFTMSTAPAICESYTRVGIKVLCKSSLNGC